jgi:hypothetical protein
MLPTIGKALDAYDRKVPLKEKEQKKKLDVDKLEDMIKSQL